MVQPTQSEKPLPEGVDFLVGMVSRLDIADLEGHLPRAYMLSRCLIEKGHDCYVIGSSRNPMVYLKPDWAIDLTYDDGPKFFDIGSIRPFPLVLELYDYPWADLAAMAKLMSSDL